MKHFSVSVWVSVSVPISSTTAQLIRLIQYNVTTVKLIISSFLHNETSVRWLSASSVSIHTLHYRLGAPVRAPIPTVNLDIITISSFLFLMSSCGLSTCIHKNMNEWMNVLSRGPRLVWPHSYVSIIVADLPLLNILRVFGRLLKAHVFDWDCGE